MKRVLFCVLVALILVSLIACGAKTDIPGIWEQEMKTAILGEGMEEGKSADSLQRFAFREDGTGIQEYIITDGSYPDVVREFTWQLEGDSLILDYGGGRTETFTATVNKTTMKLENNRGNYDLTRAE